MTNLVIRSWLSYKALFFWLDIYAFSSAMLIRPIMTIVMFAQGGLSGLIVMHEPIWKTDYRLFGRMMAPYARGIGATFVATIGAIGLIEIIYFLSTRVTEETNTVLFWMEVDAASALPWAS